MYRKNVDPSQKPKQVAERSDEMAMNAEMLVSRSRQQGRQARELLATSPFQMDKQYLPCSYKMYPLTSSKLEAEVGRPPSNKLSVSLHMHFG